MNKRIFAVALASLLVTVACSRKHNKKDKPVSPAQKNVLQETFSVWGDKFDAKDQTVSSKIAGISARIDKKDGANTNGAMTAPTATMRFAVAFKGAPGLAELSSDAMSFGDVKTNQDVVLKLDQNGGEMNDYNITDYIGGKLSARARCLDADCSRVALRLAISSVTSQDPSRLPKLAGVIFAYQRNGSYTVETSNSGVIPSVEQALAVRK